MGQEFFNTQYMLKLCKKIDLYILEVYLFFSDKTSEVGRKCPCKSLPAPLRFVGPCPSPPPPALPVSAPEEKSYKKTHDNSICISYGPTEYCCNYIRW